MNEQRLHIQALQSVVDRLKREEPKCGPCEQCWYGYKYDKVSKQKCKELQEEKSIEHSKWEERYDYWLKELNKCTLI